MTTYAKILEQIHTNDSDLTRLDLRDKTIDNNDAIILANALKDNHTLTELYLSNNSIGNDGLIALADALKGNHTLTILSLRNNNIGQAGVIALAHALKDNRVLTALDLESNYSINDASATALADALKGNHTLTILNLKDNIIQDEGKQALTDALITSKNIIHVNLAIEALDIHCSKNRTTAIDLIKKIKEAPTSLTLEDLQKTQDRIHAMVYAGKLVYNLPKDDVLKMLANIGIKPVLGEATQKVNLAREAQRLAALRDPSQGI